MKIWRNRRWNDRLVHHSKKVVKVVITNCKIPLPDSNSHSFCSACCTTDTKLLQLVHSNLWRPSPMLSYSGYRYYISFIDAFSRFNWIFLLKHKSDGLQTFSNFKTQVELQLGYKIKAIQTDCGGEYRAFTNLLMSHGIIHRNSCPHAHELNRIAERKHFHIVENGLTLLAKASNFLYCLLLKIWTSS